MGTKARLEYVGGGHDKFWMIEVKGSETHVRWGRNGTIGQTQVKNHHTNAHAEYFAKTMIGKKINGGYREVFTSQFQNSWQTAPVEQEPESVKCIL